MAVSPSRELPPDHDVRRARLSESLRNGLWFVPAVCVAGAMALAWVLHLVDRHLADTDADPLALAFRGDASSAQQVLSTVASSTMTFTGLVFSITVVALQLASSQFSPRVMRTFFRDRGTKLSLGVFVATFVYSLLVLRTVRPEVDGAAAFVPGVSISAAFVLVLCSLATFVYYVNHVAHSIRAVAIIESVAAETRAAIRSNHPPEPPGPPPEVPDRTPDLVLAFDHGPGALLGVDEDDLVEVARRNRCLLRLRPVVGDFLASGTPLFDVWADDPAEVPTLTSRDVLGRVGVGRERTMRQDVAFGFRQLVDMAERALSPAVNDPTTAVQALDRIHDLLRRLASRPTPTGAHHDADGRLRLLLPVVGWEEQVGLALDEIRRYGEGSLQVQRRMRAVIDDLLTVTGPDRRAPLERQRRLLDAAARRAFLDDEDLQPPQRAAGGASTVGTAAASGEPAPAPSSSASRSSS